MESYDRFHPSQPNDYDSAEGSYEQIKKVDKGYGFVYRKVPRKDGKLKNKKIELYTSGDFGSSIRDATSGNYFSEKVGTFGEEMFIKVGLSTGELKCKNGSSTLFFISPEEYEKTLNCKVGQELKNEWLERKSVYIASVKKTSKK
jgi:hypothetical protein